MKRVSDIVRQRPALGWLLFALTMGATFLVGLFASSIMERRVESQTRFQQNVPIGEWESDPEKWKVNFPREYESWKKTADSSFKSKYAGSFPRDTLAEHPYMVVLWAGYAFSRDYLQARGHAHTVQDIRETLRTDVPQPGTCWTCKSSDVPRLMKEMGIGEFYKSKWADLGPKVHQTVSCLDCHDPKTMNLRVVRPAIIEAFERQGKDIRQSSQQEMRSLVCAQCHVEYYFKDKTTYYLTFPWDKGTTADQIEAYYDEKEFYDWEHPLSKTKMLKAQHPDFEVSQMGIHRQRGISCADCHMPYQSEGGVKVTDHHIQSPLNNINNSCQVCHTSSADDLRRNVEDRQDKNDELRRRAEELLARAHIEAKAAWDAGATEAEMKPVQTLIRHGQWRWDYAVAGHGNSFHAPLEVARVLGTSIERAQQARLELSRILARHGVTEPVSLPDLSTKEKAQAFIGLKMDELIAHKKPFLADVIPTWDKLYAESQK